MSIQFGTWNFEGQPATPDYMEKVSTVLAPYGPDGHESYSKGGLKMLYGAFHTTNESHRERQPFISPSGTVITWDGRLDNRADVVGDLRDSLTSDTTDVAIVAAAYDKWGAKCLGKLIGDWALSIWNPRGRSVLLAKDPIGTKHLYYSFDGQQVTWSTVLDPLVLFAGRTLEICEEYIASWLTNQFPPAGVTPYVGILAVQPSCSVLLRPGKYGTEHIINKYWGFDPGKRIRYRSDAEYQEHFLSVFSTAVQRRLRSDRPVLAELSGGMDSSSIVCMADLIMGVGAQESTRHSYLTSSSVECPRLDTISWFGDFYEHLEPDTNDFPWISKVEQKRGRIGFHINLSQMRYKETRSLRPIMSAFDSGGFASTPAPRTLSNFFKLYAAHMVSQGYRVTISGVGGDHVTGREPTPLPELQNLLVRGRFVRLVLQLNAWASKVNKSHLSLLWEAVQEFFPTKNLARDIFAAPWFRSEFIRRNRATLCGSPTRVKFLGHQPSFQHSLAGLDGERRLAACWDPNPHLLREVRYPYLDRDFLSFMYAIPRDQIVRVGQHRFVMKLSLVGIVPDELLNRERKAFRRPESERVKERDGVAQVVGSVAITEQMVASLIQIIDSDLFLEALQNVSAREEARIRMLVLTLKLESWLRHLASHGIVAHAQPTRGASAFVDDEASRTIPSIQSSAC